MSKIYLIQTSAGSYEDYHTNIEKAFYTEEKAIKFRDDYNEELRKMKYKEKMKEKRGKDFDYWLLYETYDAQIKEVEIE